MFRSTNLRFFNNMAVVVSTEDEKVEALRSITDSVGVAMELVGIHPDMWFAKLEKKRSKVPNLHSNYNVVASGEASLRNVGSRALQNVTSQISKLNPISKLRLSAKRNSDSDATAAAGSGSGGDKMQPNLGLGGDLEKAEER